jgi:POT family proton-dependent oligopeptide transporter
LVLYASKHLLQPGHVENVLFFPQFRSLIEGSFGHELSPLRLATMIGGLYTTFVYLTPLLGGPLADRVLGRTATVTLGASLMALGHFLMAFDATFLIALLCLVLGVGCFKGNIAAQLGDLYRTDDPRRADGFQVYFLGIQLAVIFSPVVCGFLAETIDWHYGFGAAGVGMVIGLAIYLAGRYSFPKERARSSAQTPAAPLPRMTPTDWRRAIILVALLPVLAASIVGNQEINNGYLVWADKALQRNLFGFNFLVEYLVSADSFISAVTLVMVVAFWRWWGTRWREPDEITKIVIGVGISMLAPLALAGAAASTAATGQPASMLWAVAFHVFNDIGFANVLPIGLALYSRAAPTGRGGTFLAIYYLHIAMCNFFIGYLAGLLELMPATTFWLLHVAIMVGAGAVLLLAKVFFGRILAPEYGTPAAAAA